MTHEAVGAIFLSIDTGRVMLNLRSETVTYANYWGFVGGKSEGNETPVECLKREITEELGTTVPKLQDIIPFDVFTTKNSKFRYYSFLVLVQGEFVPNLNDESSGYCWVKIGNWPQPLHPGARSTLHNETLLEDFKNVWNAKKNGKLLSNNLPF
ncbi:NUDIX domain protein [Vibrio phage 2.275.O._10N.286.54.E11]|nr:NUDIX domain protein [Vibrio phage 2.275.O._10N.286.54.E11]